MEATCSSETVLTRPKRRDTPEDGIFIEIDFVYFSGKMTPLDIPFT
jgi:hypothetical protein